MSAVDIIVLSVRQNTFLYVYWDICSCAFAQTCWTRNKSDYWVHGVMFNNKMYYLPRSMCVALAIKCNEWKALEGRRKFWCVAILSTLWQHTACQGCKTSSNRLLNIRLLHSYTLWWPYIKSGPHAKVCEPAKCVKDCMVQNEDTLQGTSDRVDLHVSMCVYMGKWVVMSAAKFNQAKTSKPTRWVDIWDQLS